MAASSFKIFEPMKTHTHELIDEAIADAAYWKGQAKELLEAAKYAEQILSKIPAFGDTIGDKVSKPQIAVAYNKLSAALAKAEGRA